MSKKNRMLKKLRKVARMMADQENWPDVEYGINPLTIRTKKMIVDGKSNITGEEQRQVVTYQTGSLVVKPASLRGAYLHLKRTHLEEGEGIKLQGVGDV